MEKQTKILGIVALVIAGLFYWNIKESEKAALDKTLANAAAEKAAADKAAADKLAADKLAAEEAANDAASIAEEKAAAEKEAAEKAAADKALADKSAAEAAEAAEAAAETARQEKFALEREEAERAAAAEKALYDLMHPTRNIEISYSSVKSDAWNNSKKYFDVYIPKLYENDKFYMLQLTFYKSNGDIEKIWDFANSYIKNNNFVVELSLTDYYHYGIVVSILENFGLPNERIVKTPKQNIQIIDDFIQVD